MNALFHSTTRRLCSSATALSVVSLLSVLSLTLWAAHSFEKRVAPQIAPVSLMQDTDFGSADSGSADSDADPATPDSTPDSTNQDTEPAPAIIPHHYIAREVEPTAAGFDTLGDLDNPDDRASIVFSSLGAGIESLKLPDEFETVAFKEHVTLQAQYTVEGSTKTAVPFAAMTLEINGEHVDISGWNAPVWSQIAVGVFEVFVDDLDGNPVARVERRYTLKPEHRHGFYLQDTIENLSDGPLRVRLISLGAIDMPKAKSTYAGDRRRVRYGYLLPPEEQGTSLSVTVDNKLLRRAKLFGKRIETQYGKAYPEFLTVWPNEDVLPDAQRLSWLALADRYFLVAMHPHLDVDSITTPEDKLLTGITSIDRIVLDPYKNSMNGVQVLRLTGELHELDAKASFSNTLGVYAGPRNRPLMNQEPEIAALNMPALVVSNLGGICAPCTFSWLTDILIGILRTFHSIVGDWAISIMLLVVLVRGCLHPVTRWSQIRVQRFSVQMQAMAPKQKAIREKYKDDSKRLQQEMGKLWKEEGISPAGMLGCLPMFLQSPVFIALYATLFFASELRHEPAFYGVFQNVFHWQFMSDLAAPDGAIPLPASMHFSFPMWGNVSSINILPVLLGVVFHLHQKYLTPPTQATMTPEQESQQKMMKVMMIFLFPVMMYAAPSGLALYFITNSTMGILENKWIRAHMKKHGMLEIENIRAEKSKKGPGFLQRMTEAADAQKQIREKGPAQPNPASKHNRRGPK